MAPIAADVDVDEVRVRRFDPRQLPVLVLGFVAEDEQTDLSELRRLAERQIAAFDEATARGEGVAVVDGKIVENLHVATARATLAKAEAIAAMEAA